MIQRWNEAGNKPIKYCSAIGAYATVWQDYNIIESEAKKLWERYIEQPWGTPEHHEYVNGKPLLVLFTITKEQWEAWDGDKTEGNPAPQNPSFEAWRPYWRNQRL